MTHNATGCVKVSGFLEDIHFLQNSLSHRFVLDKFAEEHGHVTRISTFTSTMYCLPSKRRFWQGYRPEWKAGSSL